MVFFVVAYTCLVSGNSVGTCFTNANVTHLIGIDSDGVGPGVMIQGTQALNLNASLSMYYECGETVGTRILL